MTTTVRIRYSDTDALATVAKALAMHHPLRLEAKANAHAEFQHDMTELAVRLQRHLADYLTEGTSRAKAEWWLKRELRYFYRRAYVEGRRAAGNTATLTVDDERVLRRLRRREYVYLRGFLNDIDTGHGNMPYPRRMQMYADATRALFWLGFVQGNRNQRRRITWRLNYNAEHCQTCLSLNGRTWTPRAFLRWYRGSGILPGKGTDCLSNCKCRLEESFI